jgi:hypothetical protein
MGLAIASALQMRAVQSSEAVAICLPSGLNAAEVTVFE